MLQILAVQEGSIEQLEEAVRRIVHKKHQLPATSSGSWTTKIFGTQTPKANELDNAARSLASDGKTVFVARTWQTGWEQFQLIRGRDIFLDLRRPRIWSDNSADPTDAWEFCIEEFGDPEEVETVAGIAPDDKEMAFLWDEAESKSTSDNLVANHEAAFVKELLALTQKNQVKLPVSVQDKMLKANKVHAFFQLLFQWQLETIQKAFRDCKLEVNPDRLAQCFDIRQWESAWVDSVLGCFPAMLSALGVPLLEEKINALEEGTDEEDFASALNVKKSFKTKDGQPQTLPLWDSIERNELTQLVFKAVNRLKPVPFESEPLSVPMTEFGDLFLMPWSIDDDLEWLLEVKLPKDTFPLPDGSTFDWTRLHPTDKYQKDLYRYKVGKRILLHALYGPRQFFPDPEGDAEFEAAAHMFDSGYPREARVKFYDFLQALPDKTKLSLYTHSAEEPLPMTTTVFRGVVNNRCFEVSSRYPDISREELTELMEFMKATRMKEAGSVYDMYDRIADAFRKRAKGTFWDPEPYAPKLIAKAGQLEINALPDNWGSSPFQHIATSVQKYSRELKKLGFEYCGTLQAPRLGSAKVICFTGPADCTAHIVIEWGKARPEFWTRFESGDILTTNTSNFLDLVKCYPKKGLYYRTYHDRPLRQVLKKHREGIQRFEDHKQTQPVEHVASIEAFGEDLLYFVKRHPDLRWLCE